MKHEHSVQVATRFALVRVQQEYASLIDSSINFSLERLFQQGTFSITEYCRYYRPHPQTSSLIDIIQAFGEKYGIWLPNAKYYVTCTMFLYPDAEFDRIVAMAKNNAVDYYLNDTMGRDMFKYLDQDKQSSYKEIIQRMATLDEELRIVPSAHQVEWANVEMLQDIRDSSPMTWFLEFLKLFNLHIEVTHKDCSAGSLGYLPTIDEYISMRNHTSGMPHIISLAEYSDNKFLDWNWLANRKLDALMRRIHRATALFGCLSNDLFSFEKEVIDRNADPNLVMAVACNHPELSLAEVIQKASGIVRNILADYQSSTTLMKEMITVLPESTEAATIVTHLNTLEKIVQASWMWQIFTKRYKRPHSIWKETQLVEDTMAVTT